MRMRNIVVLSLIMMFFGSLLLVSAPAQTYSEYMDLTWSDTITVDKTYTWNFEEVTWEGLTYLGETIDTGSTIEFKILADMPADSSAYEEYCAGFDPVIQVKINGNEKVYSELVAGEYSTYLAYLLIPLEASYPDLEIYLEPYEYLPLVIPISSGGEIDEEDVLVYADAIYTYTYAEETDVVHDGRTEVTTGVTALWQAWDPLDESNYLTLTMEGYSGEIPEIGGEPGIPEDDDIKYDDFDWEAWAEEWADNWSLDWNWEDAGFDWDEWDFDPDDYDIDIWSNGTEDLCFEDLDWDALLEEYAELEDWDWGSEGLEDLGVYFTLDSETEINHIHIELEVEVDKDMDTSSIKLYYYDEDEEVWVKIETSAYDEDSGKVVADIDHLTVFAAATDEMDEPVDKDDAPGFAAVLVLFGLAGAVLLLKRR